jgi:hypothetical protein
MNPISNPYDDDMDEKLRSSSPSHEPWTGPQDRRPSSTGSSGSSTAFMPTLDHDDDRGTKDNGEDDYGYSSTSSLDDKDEDDYDHPRRGRRGVGNNKADPSEVPLLTSSLVHPESRSTLSQMSSETETEYDQTHGRKVDWVGMNDLENGAGVPGVAKRVEEQCQVKRISPWIMSECLEVYSCSGFPPFPP